jgi:hypothetical protein
LSTSLRPGIPARALCTLIFPSLLAELPLRPLPTREIGLTGGDVDVLTVSITATEVFLVTLGLLNGSRLA